MNERYVVEESSILGGGFEIVDTKEANLICMCYTRSNGDMIEHETNKNTKSR